MRTRPNIVLETTANKILCHGAEFTVIIKVCNDGEPFDAVIEHTLGRQLELASHSCNVGLIDDCCQRVRIHLRAKRGCTRVQYNVKVTPDFLLPMGRTCVKLVAIDGKPTRIDSNWASLGLTPITPKPFLLSQPVPCPCPAIKTRQCRC
jgi:hypothetical protein